MVNWGTGVKEGPPEEVTLKANAKDEQELELARRREGGSESKDQQWAIGGNQEDAANLAAVSPHFCSFA